MKSTVGWGILGPGTIAKAFVLGIQQSPNGHVTAIASRSLDKAKAFATEMKASQATCYGSYEQLLTDDNVDVIYIATPHPMHARWAIAAAEAGKHVVTEKPAGLNHAETMAMVEAARDNDVFFMEAFKDRCHPQTTKLLELLRDKVIGEIRMVRSAFGFGGGDTVNPDGRTLNPALGGGGILDVGCYPVALVRLIAGAIEGKPFANPVEVRGVGHLGQTGVDEWAAATLRFASGMVAEVATAVRASLDNSTLIVGAHGSITLPDPWLNSRTDPTDGKIIVKVNGKEDVYKIPAKYSAFGYEAVVAADAILAGSREAPAPAMTPADTLGQMATLDAWREQIKLSYPGETPAGFDTPLRPKAKRKVASEAMTYGQIPGIDLKVSKLVMGCDNQRSFPHAAVMFDDWFERGGNTFDTAHVYGGGAQEKLLGQWHRSRNVRDQMNIIVKGGHTPNCYPTRIRQQLFESLDRLQIDTADFYILHRDNPDLPVGELVDCLSQLVDEGKIKVFGGSNWSVQRFAEANAYAKAHGKHPFTVMSNNLSLARMNKPVWDGCIAVSPPEPRQFLIEHQVPNFAWSSQARGYFVSPTGGGASANESDEIWDSPDNRERRRRAFELADKRGVTAINIAAAYVLNQPFPSFALVGPRTLRETATTLPALAVTLAEDEMAWLDLRD